MDVAAQDIDTLSDLEERITRAVHAITALRGENSQLQERLKATEAELDSTRAARDEAQALSNEFQNDNNQLGEKLKQTSEELGELRGERTQVKTRIEKLLGQLDLLD
jgi:chromosome segregation ATPase